MRKLLFSVAMLTFVGANAQTFGLKGGLNISYISNYYEEPANPKSKIGFNAGVFYNQSLNEKLKIQPELLYSSKGMKYKYGTEEFSYLSLPVFIQYSIVPNLYIEAGPEISYLLSSKDKFNGNEDYYGETIDNMEDMKKIDFGLGLGLGYNITNEFGVNARYVQGLLDVYKETTEGDIAKNSVLQIGVYYKFK